MTGGRRDPAAVCLLRALSLLLGHLPEHGREMGFEGLYGAKAGRQIVRNRKRSWVSSNAPLAVGALDVYKYSKECIPTADSRRDLYQTFRQKMKDGILGCQNVSVQNTVSISEKFKFHVPVIRFGFQHNVPEFFSP